MNSAPATAVFVMQPVPRLALAVAIALAAFALQWALWDFISPYSWFLFFPAVLLAAVLSGRLGGVAATGVSALLVWYTFIPPRFSFALDDPRGAFSIFAFALTGFLFSLFGEQLHHMRRRMAAAEYDARLHQALEQSEQRYRTVFQTSLDAITITRLSDGMCIEVNPSFLDILGYERAEVIGRTLPELGIWADSGDRRHLLDILRQDAQCRNLESLFRKKNGELRWGMMSAAVTELDGIPCILAITRDVTEIKEAQGELKRHRTQLEQLVLQRTAELQAANVAKSAFLANMSHEIRTPLHVITGLAHLLRHDAGNPLQRERLDHLCASSEHLLDIVNDILDLSKIEAAQLTIDRADFRLGAVADKVVPMLEERARAKGLALTTDIAPQLREMELNGDALRLTQVLINLCGNAVKFTGHGTVSLGIGCLAADAAGVTLRFAVSDTGIGIAPADRARLFQPFAQADASSTRNYEGTGLGLAISQRLVALMGGAIRVESSLGTGSTFSFDLVLPRATASVPQAAAVPAAADFHGRHVLLAEDHPLSQEILLEMLEDIGCEGDVASDGAEAVERAQARGYDLILMDMQMPKLDGLAATRAIRALPGHRATPIIALTANAFADDRRRCLDAGMSGHLGKPVTPATLAAVLGLWLPDLSVPGVETPLCDNELSRALAQISGLSVAATWRRSPEQLADYCGQLNRFVQLHGADMTLLFGYLDAGNHDAAHTLAHNLKGIAGLMGVRRIASLAHEIVQALRREADMAIVKYLAALCDAELAKLTEVVETLPALPAASAAA